MIKATLFTSPFYLSNRIFDISDNISNRDNSMYGFYLLKQKLKEHGIDISTQDINSPFESEFIIYNEMPKVNDILPNKQNYLLLFESEIIRPDNWDVNRHRYFEKIFTWNDSFVDSVKYIKFNFPNKIDELPREIENHKNDFCTMIAGYKFKRHPLELYSERIKIIRWFEQNHPEDFDLYGMGWDKFQFKGIFSALNRFERKFQLISKFLKPKFPSYEGPVNSKKETLEKYKFAICYENARDIPGYITEKIFDCFFAGCVPIYWGAPNVTEHIPADTFIDRRNFSSYEGLYNYIQNMTDEEYTGYLQSIRDFIESAGIYPFSAECFAETLITEIVGNSSNESHN
ncbi:MAG: hypothetical protein K8R11_01740 [Methanococcoides sp.]|nr:hypothetical protein [Methanococcoides sp.]